MPASQNSAWNCQSHYILYGMKPTQRAATARKQRDSSRTRVAPVFSILEGRTDNWPAMILDLAADTISLIERPWINLRMSPAFVYFGDKTAKRKERGFEPPRSLLEWLIHNVKDNGRRPLSANAIAALDRQRILDRDPDAQSRALIALDHSRRDNPWCRFEGPTYPDAVIETPDALIVVEGKRTEGGPTTKTTWMMGRHQMLRHIDGAFEAKGSKRVFGLFIVETDPQFSRYIVPDKWIRAARETISADAIEKSLPHRSEEHQKAIAKAFVGVTTWTAVCRRLRISEDLLPDVVSEIQAAEV
jgi:hypothetical protein